MNENQRRLLPPIGALASFVAAANRGSFSRAADDMGLTQSAISRQIAVLEDWLQVALFKRTGRRVALSAEGDAYAKAVGPALERIRSASASVLGRHARGELNIATLPSFGMRWLAPRLRQLTSQYPDMVVNFAARSVPFDFADEPFDAAIHFGLPDWAGGKHDRLFQEEAIPVCSASLLRTRPVVAAEDLLTWPLLVQSSRWDAWAQWFAAAGVEATPPPPSASFEHFVMLGEAAAAGAGIALIPRFLIETELSEGHLVAPLPMPLGSAAAYYLVLPEGRPLSPAMTKFRRWLMSEAQSFESRAMPGLVVGQNNGDAA